VTDGSRILMTLAAGSVSLVFSHDATHCADYAVARCLFVCLSATCRYSVETAKHNPQLCHHQVAPPFPFFPHHNCGNIPTGTTYRRVWKIASFDQYLALSPKRYKIGPQLLWNANRKQYPSFEWYHFQWPWVATNPDFKVTPLFEYLINGTI